MTLPAAAAERRRLQHGAVRAPAAIDRYIMLAANLPAERWDRQTDGRTPDRYIELAPHTMRAAFIWLYYRAFVRPS